MPTMLAATPVQKATPADQMPDPQPERIARPPVEDVDAEGRDHECDREMHHHHVDRVPDQRDRRADIEPIQFQNDLALGLGSRDRLVSP